jgi:hypothetical protein
MRDLFLFKTDPIPSPLRVFGRETTSHLTLHIFFPILSPDHKKDLNFLSIAATTILRMRKMEG